MGGKALARRPVAIRKKRYMRATTARACQRGQPRAGMANSLISQVPPGVKAWASRWMSGRASDSVKQSRKNSEITAS